MSMIKDMKTYLVAGGVSVPISLGCMSADETCIGLFRYAGAAPFADAGIERIGLQTRCKAANYEEAIANSYLVCSILSKIGDEQTDGAMVDIDGTKYARVRSVASSESLGSDLDGVHEVVQNFEVSLISEK